MFYDWVIQRVKILRKRLKSATKPFFVTWCVPLLMNRKILSGTILEVPGAAAALMVVNKTMM